MGAGAGKERNAQPSAARGVQDERLSHTQGEHADEVLQDLDAAKGLLEGLQRKLAAKPEDRGGRISRDDSSQQIAQLRAENERLKRELANTSAKEKDSTEHAASSGREPTFSPTETPAAGHPTTSPQETCGEAWKRLFSRIDASSAGVLSWEQVQTAFAEEGQMALSFNTNYQRLKQEFEQGSRTNVGLHDFQALAEENFYRSYTSLFKSLDIPELLARVAHRHATGRDGCEPFLLEEAESACSFRSLRNKSAEVLEALARRLLRSGEEELAKAMARAWLAAGEYRQREGGQEGKFSSMRLGSVRLFDSGLEGVIGAPQLDFGRAVAAEHSSDTAFKAWNNGKQRESSPAREWERVLPLGLEGPLNVFDYEGKQQLCSDFMAHPKVRAARLSKVEVAAVRMYTGPMYARYNAQLRGRLRRIEELAAGSELQWLDAEARLEAAVAQAQREAVEGRAAGAEDFTTTIFVLASALVKLRLHTRLPARRRCYRGFAGLEVPECFKTPDAQGCRSGCEFGFLSTSTSREQAVGYIDFRKGLPQLFEIQMGDIDKGADLSWISYFPAEEEVLLPPLSSLECLGNPQYEDVEVQEGEAARGGDGGGGGGGGGWRTRKVMVWPVRLNVNLRARTLEELVAVRQKLHSEMGANVMVELRRVVGKAVKGQGGRRAEGGNGEGESEGAREAEEEEEEGEGEGEGREAVLGRVVLAQSQEVLGAWQSRGPEAFNEDREYRAAIEQVLDLKPLAEMLLRLREPEVVQALLKEQSLGELMGGGRREVGGAAAAAGAEAAFRACKARGLVAEEVEEADAQGRTALMRAAAAGDRAGVALLLVGGAKRGAVSRQGETALTVALREGRGEVARLLVRAKAQVDVEDGEGRKVFGVMLALGGGCAEVVPLLLEGGGRADAVREDGATALHVAAVMGEAGAARALLDAGCDPAARDGKGKSAVQRGWESGKEEVVSALVRGGCALDNDVLCAAMGGEGGQGKALEMLEWCGGRVDFERRDGEGRTALHVASGLRAVEAAGALVRVGCPLEGRDAEERTALHCAAASGGVAVVVVLVEAGAEVEARASGGRTALLCAASAGEEEVVEELVKRGAEVNARDDAGGGGLHAAVEGGHGGMVEVLVGAGVEVQRRNGRGRTALREAIEGGKEEAVVALRAAGAADVQSAVLLDDEAMLERALESGEGVDEADAAGATALFCAAHAGCARVAERLLERRAATEVRCGEHTALLEAVKEGKAEVARLLVEAAADVNARDALKYTALHCAAAGGMEGLGVRMVELGADVKAKNHRGDTALMVAARKGMEGLARALVAGGAEVEAQNARGEGAVWEASKAGEEGVLKVLVEEGKAAVNVSDVGGNSALLVASEQGRVGVARMLVEAGADVAARTRRGRHPLLAACDHGQLEIAKMLVEQRAEVDAGIEEGETALLAASEKGFEEVVAMLLQSRAAVDAGARAGQHSPLIKACEKRHAGVAMLLLDHGADVGAQGSHGVTALLSACRQGLGEVASRVLRAGAEVNAATELRTTPLIAACEEGLEEVALELVEAGADVNARSMAAKGSTALVWAADRGMARAARRLVEAGADVEGTGSRGDRALMRACAGGHVAVAELLLERRCEVDARNARGSSALLQAAEGGQAGAVELLLRNSAQVDLRSNAGLTPLLALAAQPEPGAPAAAAAAAARLLLHHRADARAVDRQGNSALELAGRRGALAIVQALREAAAAAPEEPAAPT